MRRNGPEPVEGPILLWSNVMPAWFYILRLRSGTLYLGATTNLEERYKDHLAGKACRTTKVDSPVALVHSEEFETNVEAMKVEKIM